MPKPRGLCSWVVGHSYASLQRKRVDEGPGKGRRRGYNARKCETSFSLECIPEYGGTREIPSEFWEDQSPKAKYFRLVSKLNQ